jgi:ferredoxin-NADP reductase
MLRAHVFAPTASPRSYLCGRTSFVEAAATTLVDLGHDPSWIRLERSARSVD